MRSRRARRTLVGMDSLTFLISSPFTTQQAAAVGVTHRRLRDLLERGAIRRLLRGVYVGAGVPDSLALRRDAVRLVVPEGAVVTDRIAGWLHGAPRILAPDSDLEVPDLSVFHRGRGRRLRNPLVDSGQRTMPSRHVMSLGGLDVTTPLRTAWDLGRLLPRTQAIAGLDSMSALGLFGREELIAGVEQFRGYRGVRQLRALAPLADGRSQSPGESGLRLLWCECEDLPRPELQIPVLGPHGATFYLDLGLPDLLYAAEYDGAAFHDETARPRDEWRRRVLREQGWVIDVLRAEDVYGPDPAAPGILRAGVRRAVAERRSGRRSA